MITSIIMNKGSQDKTSKEERNMCYNLEDEKKIIK